MKKIECVIMDWAGTAVDYGCFAPVAAFMESFKRIEMPVTVEDIRSHMGLTKIEEIRALLNMPKVEECFIQKNGRSYSDKDIQDCYITFQHVLFTILEDFSKPIPGVVETISGLREKGLKIGSTTGNGNLVIITCSSASPLISIPSQNVPVASKVEAVSRLNSDLSFSAFVPSSCTKILKSYCLFCNL